MSEIITVDEIEAGIDPKHRKFFLVSAAPLPRAMIGIVEAFWKAVAAISPALRFSHAVHITFATAPFKLNLQNGELRYTPHSEVIGVCIENLIFLDCNKLTEWLPDAQVACILEELVHGLMHVSDEHLVSIIVSALYPAITWSNGKYSITKVVS